MKNNPKKLVFIFTGLLLSIIMIGIISLYTTNAKPTPTSTQMPVQDEIINTQIEALQTAINQPNLSPQLEKSLHEKLTILQTQATQQAEIAQNPAPKNDGLRQILPVITDSPFPVGIFPGGADLVHPFEMTAQNTWQGIIDDQFYQIIAGKENSDLQQSLLVILVTSSNRMTTSFETHYATSANGALTIVACDQLVLLLSDENGNLFSFDVQQRLFK